MDGSIDQKVNLAELVYDCVRTNLSISNDKLYKIIKSNHKYVYNNSIRKAIIVLKYLKLINTKSREGVICVDRNINGIKDLLLEFYKFNIEPKIFDESMFSKLKILEKLKVRLADTEILDEQNLLNKIISIYELNLANGNIQIPWKKYKSELEKLLSKLKLSKNELDYFFINTPKFARDFIAPSKQLKPEQPQILAGYKINTIQGLMKGNKLKFVLDSRGKIYQVIEVSYEKTKV